MRNPYEVLGVSPSASDADIQKAYRELVKKYHPDNYANNPLNDLADEKMREINEAYDSIMMGRGSGKAQSDAGSGGYQTAQGSPKYAAIRSALASGQIEAAERMLNDCATRDAEWYFLMGSVCQLKGWYDDACRNFDAAASMEPSNMEYRQSSQRVRNAGRNYRSQGGPGMQRGAGGMSSCDCCTSLICADCLCECCGGDLISCC